MAWRGLWDGDWDGLWEGASEPLAPGFIVGYAAISIAATGALVAAAGETAPVVGGTPQRKPLPLYFYYEPVSQEVPPVYLASISGTARIKISASGTLTYNTAEIYDLEAFRHDEAVLMFAAGWR